MGSGSYCVQRANTLDFAPRERAEFWTEHVQGYHCLLDFRFRDGRDFHGGTIRQRGQRFQLVEFWSDGLAYLRSSRQAARDSDTDLRLILPTRGRLCVRLADDAAFLGPGEAGLLPMGSSFELRHDEAARALILTLAHTDAPPRACARIDLRSGLGAIVASSVTGLAAQRDRLTGPEFDTACGHVAELLGMLAAPEPAPSRLEQVERAFRAHVAAHADHPELCGASAAAELGWSLRQVQAALQRAGTTPRELIREERLRRAHRRLRDPALRHLSITQLAFASGFTAMSTFGEAFRHRYGITPRDLRPDPPL